MSLHNRNTQSALAFNQSPCKTQQEITELSRENAAKKLNEKKLQETEFKLRQQEVVNQRLQEQLQNTIIEAQDIGNQFQQALQDLHNLKQSSQKKDNQIALLLQENEKVVEVLERIKNEQQTNEIERLKQIKGLEQQLKDRYNYEKKVNDEMKKKQNQLTQQKLQYEEQIRNQDQLINEINEKLMTSEKQWSTDASLGHLAKKRGKQIEILTHQNNELQLNIQQLSNQHEFLQNEINKLNDEKRNDIQKNLDLQQFIKQLEENHRDQLDQLRETQIEQINTLKEQQKLEIQNKIEQIETIKQDISVKVIKNMKNSTLPIVEELKSARNTIQDLQSEIQHLKISQYKSLQGEAEDIQSKFDNLNKQNTQIKETNFLLQQKIKKDEIFTKNRINELEKEVKKLESIILNNNTKIDELEHQVNDLEQYKNKNLESIRQRVDSTKHTCELETKLKRSQDEVEKLKNENLEKQNKLNILQDQVKQTNFEKENEIQMMRLECTQEIKSIQDSYKAEIIAQQKLANDAQKPFFDQMKSAQIENSKLNQTITRMQKEIKVLEERITNILLEKEQLEKQLQKSKQFEEHLQNDKKILEKKLQDANQTYHSLEDKFVKEVTIQEKLKEKVERETQRANGCRVEIQRWQNQVEQLTNKINDLELKVRESTQESRVLKNQLVEGLRQSKVNGKAIK